MKTCQHRCLLSSVSGESNMKIKDPNWTHWTFGENFKNSGALCRCSNTVSSCDQVYNSKVNLSSLVTAFTLVSDVIHQSMIRINTFFTSPVLHLFNLLLAAFPYPPFSSLSTLRLPLFNFLLPLSTPPSVSIFLSSLLPSNGLECDKNFNNTAQVCTNWLVRTNKHTHALNSSQSSRMADIFQVCLGKYRLVLESPVINNKV